jgi:hypothetical protein
MALLSELLGRGVLDVWLPNYYCTTVPDLLRESGISVRRYSLDREMCSNLTEIPKKHAVVLVDYFGVTGAAIKSDLRRLDSRAVIVDNCMSFWGIRAPSTSFFSPRKFFGVEDGGLLVNSIAREQEFKLRAYKLSRETSFLDMRAAGYVSEGRELFLESERQLSNQKQPLEMSLESQEILGSLDLDFTKKRRLKNYSILKQIFPNSEFEPYSDDVHTSAPLCFPLRSRNAELKRQELASVGVFCPAFWPGCTIPSYDDVGRALLNDFLFLPVDHRYDEDDIVKMADLIKRHI